jgi:hypothetical protein
MIDREVFIKEFGSLIRDLTALREAWANYDSEMFMAGKVEASDLFLYRMNETFIKILEANHE